MLHRLARRLPQLQSNQFSVTSSSKRSTLATPSSSRSIDAGSARSFSARRPTVVAASLALGLSLFVQRPALLPLSLNTALRTSPFGTSRSFATKNFISRIMSSSNDAPFPPSGAAPGTGSSKTPPPALYGNFDLVKRVEMDHAPGMSVEKWRSRVTGLSVVWADFESPLLNSYVTLATEIFTDSGVPHTLEHLIFLGSEEYPYKGVLDSLANRAFAQGTNAWTANDHTAYTLTTAGSDGFLRMLPVYLDHVLFPTLTKSGFVTEVYHVNAKAEDAGVVFSEMQGRENSSGDLMELKSQRMLYPRSSAYRSETGGLMSALRVLTIDEIRDYHQRYYAPHNAALVICGPLERSKLLDTLQPVEDRIVAKGLAFGTAGPRGWKRPFVETTSAIPPVIDGAKDIEGVDPATPSQDGEARDPKRRRAVVDFPEKDESMGEVQLTWLGPKIDDWLEGEALSILGTYLTDSAVSPIQQAFVERDDPLCTDVYFGNADKAGLTTLMAYFSSVPTKKLEGLDKQLVTLLEQIAEKGIDMKRMAMIIKRDRLKLLNNLETKPADAFADVIISDFLYGKLDGSDLAQSMDDMRRFDQLEKYTSQQWVDLLRKYYITGARLVLIGRPSASLADKLKSETKSLVETRKKELGEAGLKKLEEQLEEAKKENDRDIPPEMLQNFAVPSVDSIKWIQVGTARNEPLREKAVSGKAAVVLSDLDRQVQAHVDGDGADLPFFVQFDHVNSSFVTITLTFSTSQLEPRLRPYINLYLATFFSLPITRLDGSGTKMTFEEVVKGLDDDTLEYEVGLGVGSGFSELISVDLKVERANYGKAIAWLRDLVWGSEFAVERLRITAAKQAQSLPEQKRDGRSISWSLSRALTHSPDTSTSAANSILALIESVPAVVEALGQTPEKVVGDFDAVRKTLLQPQNMRVSVAGDILHLSRPRSDWVQHFVQGWKPTEVLPVPWSRDTLTPLGKQPSKKGIICSLPTIESSYAVFSAKGISDFQHPDNAALVTTLAILNAMESYLWRYIRGAGLAYGASIRSDPEAQHIHFSLYRSPDSAKAFLEARKVIQSLAAGEMALDETTLESAKSSLHFSVADSEGTVGLAAIESFVDSAIKGVGKGRGRRLLEEVQKVTLADVQKCLRTYVLPIFDPVTSVCAIASASTRVDEIRKALADVGYEMERRDLDGDEEDGTSGSESESEDGNESGSESEGEGAKGRL